MNNPHSVKLKGVSASNYATSYPLQYQSLVMKFTFAREGTKPGKGQLVLFWECIFFLRFGYISHSERYHCKGLMLRALPF